MRVNNISRNSTNFTGLLNNKILLKSLANISEHGTSFAAGTSLAMSLTVRPLAIWATPDTEKENKQYAISNSICSGIVKFGMVEAIALPVENAVKNIDKDASSYLKPETIKNLTGKSEMLVQAKSYKLASQIVKLGTGFLSAVPKSVLTVAFIPIIMDKLFNIRKPEVKGKNEEMSSQEHKGKTVSFKGHLTERLSRGIGKFIDNKYVQNFAIKHEADEKNIAKHMSAMTDILLTASSAVMTNRSPDIKEDRKKALIYNNISSTFITLSLGYGVDNVLKKNSEKFIERFSKINKADPMLHKYIEGINILRPALIFAGIYYGVLPIFSTYIAEKIDKFITRKNSETKFA